MELGRGSGGGLFDSLENLIRGNTGEKLRGGEAELLTR